MTKISLLPNDSAPVAGDILAGVETSIDTTENFKLSDLAKYFGNIIHPVGCIYAETTGVNPGTTFGFGTWVAYAAGRVLVGAGTSDETFTAGATGGESNHVLSIAELAAHNHGLPNGGTGNTANNPGAYLNAQWTNGTSGATASSTGTASAGAGTAHNNLQPYIVVYMWERTA